MQSVLRSRPSRALAAEVGDVPPSLPPSRASGSSRAASWLDFPWSLALVIAAVVATAMHRLVLPLGELLVANDRVGFGEVWRLATGPLLHATWGHLVRDCALLLLVGVAYEHPLSRDREGRSDSPMFGWFVAFALVVPTVATLSLTDASWYCGLSGVSHAYVAAAIVLELRQRRGRVRAIVFAIGVAFAAKPLYELVTGMPAFPMDLGADVRQVPIAHATGVLLGVAFAWFAMPIGIGVGSPSPCHTTRHADPHRAVRELCQSWEAETVEVVDRKCVVHPR